MVVPDLGRVPLGTELDDALNPVKIGLFGALAVVLAEVEVADAIEQKHRRNVPHQTGPFGPRIANHGYDSQGLCFTLPMVVRPISAEYAGEGD